MNQERRLTHFLRIALEKVSKKEFKKPSEALISQLPAIIEACTVLIQSGTQVEKKTALELVSLFWARLLRDEKSKRVAAEKRKKPEKIQMSDEEFSFRITHIEDSVADRLWKILNEANTRRQAKYHGG